MFVAVTALPAAAQMSTVYGTVYIGNHDRNRHDKRTKHHFNAPVPGEGVIVIRSTAAGTHEKPDHHRHEGDDSDKDRSFRKVKIELNGEEVAEQRRFKKGVEELRYDVDLLASNTMKVKVKGCNECSLELSVLGQAQAPAPPLSPVTAIPVPPPLLPM